jgi:hypothetical protein
VLPLTDDDPRQVGGFRLLFRLGAGGMGRVYLGRSGNGRYVALKMVHPGLASAPGFRERFGREIRASQAVSGAGTVAVVAADADAPTPWLASAYVPGPSLAQVVHEHGPLPEAAVWRLLSGLAEALGSVHASGLVHRDLKPSNVLVAQGGPRLIDFGIARAADDTALTGTGMAVGSVGYMPPEQAEGREVTQAGDVFALGAVLMYAATGRAPFGSGSGPEVLYRVVHHEPELGEMPEALAGVVRRCLAKRPEERPSLDELRDTAAPHTGDGDWLPGPVASEIARRAEHLLNLETDSPDDRPAASAAGHTHTPTEINWHAAPTVARTAMSGSDTPGGVVVAPWVRGRLLGRPMLSLWGLIPMAGLQVIAPMKQELVRRYPEDAAGIDYVGLAEWAQGSSSLLPLTALLALALIWLQYRWTRLERYAERDLRIWTAASAAYWLLWTAAIALNAAWYAGMEDAFRDEVRADVANSFVEHSYLTLDRGVGISLFCLAGVAAFVVVPAVVRLGRALTHDITVRG